MTRSSFDDPHSLLASLHRTNARGERAENSRELLAFTAEALRELPEHADVYQTVRRVVDLLCDLHWYGSSNAMVLVSREETTAWKNEFAEYLRALVQLDLLAARFGLPVGHFYVGDDTIRSALHFARQMLGGYAVSDEQIDTLVRENLKGEGDSCEFRLTWVLRQLSEAPERDVSGMTGPVPAFDRPVGGGARSDLNIARSVACRRLHEVLPDFAKRRWTLQARLLSWAGLGEVKRNHVLQAVVGNRRRMD